MSFKILIYWKVTPWLSFCQSPRATENIWGIALISNYNTNFLLLPFSLYIEYCLICVSCQNCLVEGSEERSANYFTDDMEVGLDEESAMGKKALSTNGV